jgi:hypothetical protein
MLKHLSQICGGLNILLDWLQYHNKGTHGLSYWMVRQAHNIHSVPRSMTKTTHPQNPCRTKKTINRVSQMINAGLDLPDTQFVQSDLKGEGKRELHFPLHHSKKRKNSGVSCWFSNSVLHFELSRSCAVLRCVKRAMWFVNCSILQVSVWIFTGECGSARCCGLLAPPLAMYDQKGPLVSWHTLDLLFSWFLWDN